MAFRKSYLDQNPEVHQPEDDIPPAVQFTRKIRGVIYAAVDARFQIDHLEEFYYGPEESLNLILGKYLLLATKK